MAGETAANGVSWRTLGLPLRDARAAWMLAGITLVLFLLTGRRDLGYFDSAELALVGEQLGLGHPPGHPLHTLTVWLLTRLPGDAIAWANLASTLPAALTVLPMASIVERLRGDAPPTWSWAVLAIGAQHMVLWEAATRCEVYALATLPTLWAVAWALHEPAKGAGRIGAAFGLGAAVNPYFALFAALPLAPRILGSWRGKGWRPPVAGIGAGLFVVVAFYAYVPLSAHRPPEVFRWATPSLFDYFRGADYAANRETTSSLFGEHLAQWLGWSLEAAVLPMALAGAGCWGWLARGSSRLAASLGWAMAVGLLCSHTVFSPSIPDYIDYLAIPFWLGLAAVAAAAPKLARVGRPYAAAVALAVALCVALSAPAPWQRTRRADELVRTMVDGAHAEAPEGAIVVVSSDHWVASLLFTQEVEGARPDLVVVPWGFASTSWYWDHLAARHDLGGFDPRGGNAALRIRRLAAALDRPVVVETAQLADVLGLEVCGVGFFGHPSCEVTPDAATEALDRALRVVGEGAPPASDVAALVALRRGELLWRQGRGREAYAAFRAGVPPGVRLPERDVPSQVPPLRRGLAVELDWDRHWETPQLAADVLADATAEDRAR